MIFDQICEEQNKINKAKKKKNANMLQFLKRLIMSHFTHIIKGN